jgi:hypothetical protein
VTHDEREVGVPQDYLRELSANLVVSRRARALIVAEIADGLACATQANIARGLAPEEAARAAVAEFGDPRWLAAGFAREHVAVAARRIGLGLVLSGPLVGGIWAAALGAGRGSWPGKVTAALSATGLFPLILVATVVAALLAVRGAGAAAHLATVGCLLGDLCLIAVAVTLPWWTGMLAVAMATSLFRAALAGAALRRIARLRAI